MTALRAKVRHGRLVVDAPTSLPEGTEVDLVQVEATDDLSAEERARLFAAIADSIREHVPGSGVDAATFLAQLRAAR